MQFIPVLLHIREPDFLLAGSVVYHTLKDENSSTFCLFQLLLIVIPKIHTGVLYHLRHIKWCADAYKVEVFNHYGEPEYEEAINAERKRIQGELDQWTGKTIVAGEERIYDRVINEIKRRLQESK